MLKEFRELVARGNVVDLAVGVIIGAVAAKKCGRCTSDLATA